jgi:hypothetical protein
MSYPGLSIKGIAAIGPTLDVWGQLKGQVKVSGNMQAAVQYIFEKQEMYYPDNPDSVPYQKLVPQMNYIAKDDAGLKPTFSAAVEAQANLDILVTPELNLGLRVGGGKLTPTIVDAQIQAFVNSTLRFQVNATAELGNGYQYGYGVYLIYNLGYSVFANIYNKAGEYSVTYSFPSLTVHFLRVLVYRLAIHIPEWAQAIRTL